VPCALTTQALRAGEGSQPASPATTGRTSSRAELEAVGVLTETYTTPLSHNNPRSRTQRGVWEGCDLTLCTTRTRRADRATPLEGVRSSIPARCRVISPRGRGLRLEGHAAAAGDPRADGRFSTERAGEGSDDAAAMFATVGSATDYPRILLGRAADGRLSRSPDEVGAQTIHARFASRPSCHPLEYGAPHR